MATRDIYECGFDETSEKTIDEAATCPECDGDLISNDGEITCTECGLIIDEQRIDHGPEWHQYDEQERKRTGAPLIEDYHDRGLSTEIGQGGDANGNTLSTRKRRQLGRLRREHARGRFQSTAERNLAYGLGEIRRITSTLELNETLREQACALFRSAQNEDLLRGRSIEAMAAASVYGACRCNGLSRTLEEVSETARVTGMRINCAYKALNVELGLPAKPIIPSEFIPRLASELDVSDAVRQRAHQLAEAAEAAGLTSGVQPTGFAAACLYKASRECGQWLTQADVATVAETSITTLRTHRDTLDESSHEHQRSQV